MPNCSWRELAYTSSLCAPWRVFLFICHFIVSGMVLGFEFWVLGLRTEIEKIKNGRFAWPPFDKFVFCLPILKIQMILKCGTHKHMQIGPRVDVYILGIGSYAGIYHLWPINKQAVGLKFDKAAFFFLLFCRFYFRFEEVLRAFDEVLDFA